jgi:Ni,Fe-hydrogenase I small subunit
MVEGRTESELPRFAVLQLSGCSGCEASLLNAGQWIEEYRLVYMPLIFSAYDVPKVDVLLISGGVRTDEDLYNLRRAVARADQVVPVGTRAISGGVASLGDRDEVREVSIAQEGRRHVPHLLPRCRPVDAVVAAERYIDSDRIDMELEHAVGRMVRAFDPCVACATHWVYNSAKIGVDSNAPHTGKTRHLLDWRQRSHDRPL